MVRRRLLACLLVGFVLAPGAAASQEDVLIAAQGATSELTKNVPSAEVLRWHAITLLTDASLSTERLDDVEGWLDMLARGADLYNRPLAEVLAIEQAASDLLALSMPQKVPDTTYESVFPFIRQNLADRVVAGALTSFDNRESTAEGLRSLRAADSVVAFASRAVQLGRLSPVLATEEAAYKADLDRAAHLEGSARQVTALDLPFGNPVDTAAAWQSVRDLRSATAIYDRNHEGGALQRTEQALQTAEERLATAQSANATIIIAATLLLGAIWVVALQRAGRYTAESAYAGQAAFLLGGPA